MFSKVTQFSPQS